MQASVVEVQMSSQILHNSEAAELSGSDDGLDKELERKRGLTYVWGLRSLKDGISIDLDGGASKGGLGKRLGVWRAEVSERDSRGLEDWSEVRSKEERAVEGAAGVWPGLLVG